MVNLIAFLVMICLVSVSTYFFNVGKFAVTPYISFVIALLVIFIIFYSLDRMKEFNVAGMRVVLNEMRETKKTFDTEVKVLLESLADATIDTAITTGRFGPSNIQDMMIQKREVASNLWHLAGEDEKTINDKVAIIDSYIIGDIVHELSRYLNASPLKKDISNDVFKELNSMTLEIRQIVPVTTAQVEEVKKILTSHNLLNQETSEYLKDINYYLTHKRLRRPISE